MTGAKPHHLHISFRDLDTRPIECLYCFLTVSWGAALLWPGDAFASAPGFSGLAYLAPDWVWGLLAVGVGLIRSYGVVFDNTGARLIASMGGGMIWCYTWSTMLLGHSVSTGVAVYGVLSLVNLLVFIKLCRVRLGGLS
jgi:hypothetical protein